MTDVVQGADVTLTVEWRTSDAGPLVDVTGQTVTITEIATSTVAVGPTAVGISHVATGVYAYTWSTGPGQATGTYLATWNATYSGDPVAATETVDVLPGPAGALASVADLTDYLQQGALDADAASLALAIASRLFAVAAGTEFAATTVTYQVAGTGSRRLDLPYRPVTDVTAVRIGGTAVTDFTRVKNVLYRPGGFGAVCAFPPDLVEVDLTYGYPAAPDDVRGAVLETAGALYLSPDVTTAAESIDDYSFRSAAGTGGVSLSPAAAALAGLYRGSYAA